ncbi:ARP2/3 complex 16 kDa subunit (p16-Arc)-domain-containing protein, partial [Geranomyces variabilis]
MQKSLNKHYVIYACRGDTPAAVIKALENPPAGREVTAVKDKNTATVMSALAAARSTDILSIVKSLDSKQTDVLMKYIYRGMASPELYNSAVLLAWHEKVRIVADVSSPLFAFCDHA